MRAGDARRRAASEPPDAAGAMEIAAHFLGTRPRTRWEIDRRLRRAGADPATIDATLQRLTELGYVDDGAFARWWAEQRDRHSPRGRRLIEDELRQRGVPRDVIEGFREEHGSPERAPEDASVPASEIQRAREALERHLRGRPAPTDRKAIARLGTYLMRRGFDGDTVRATVRAATRGQDDTEE